MQLGPNYETQKRPGDVKRRLVFVLSQKSAPVFGSVDFGAPVIDVWERKTSYYTLRSDNAVKAIADSLPKGVAEVCFVGCSKAGYGALLWGTLLAGMVPSLRVSALAFSPQTRLYPRNPNISFPSYLKLVSGAEVNEKTRRWLEKRGTLPPFKPNFHAHVIYPAFVESDRTEAERLTSPSVKLTALPLSCHTTIIPFVSDMTNVETVKAKVAALRGASSKDADVSSFINGVPEEQLVREYHALKRTPSVAELVGKTFAGRLPSNRIIVAWQSVKRRLWPMIKTVRSALN